MYVACYTGLNCAETPPKKKRYQHLRYWKIPHVYTFDTAVDFAANFQGRSRHGSSPISSNTTPIPLTIFLSLSDGSSSPSSTCAARNLTRSSKNLDIGMLDRSNSALNSWINGSRRDRRYYSSSCFSLMSCSVSFQVHLCLQKLTECVSPRKWNKTQRTIVDAKEARYPWQGSPTHSSTSVSPLIKSSLGQNSLLIIASAGTQPSAQHKQSCSILSPALKSCQNGRNNSVLAEIASRLFLVGQKRNCDTNL